MRIMTTSDSPNPFGNDLRDEMECGELISNYVRVAEYILEYEKRDAKLN
jgi:hypothetical protein